jgi:DNA-binding NtrC family response regulator
MTHGDPTILLVDDEEDTAALLSEVLGRRGYRVVPVLSAMQCLEYLRDGATDIVITDLQMPEMSGIDLCRELSVRHPDVLVIILTGVVGLKHSVSATRAGAYDFLVKPVKTDLLESALQRALQHLALRREAHRSRQEPALAVDGSPRSTPVDP